MVTVAIDNGLLMCFSLFTIILIEVQLSIERINIIQVISNMFNLHLLLMTIVALLYLL